MDQSTVFVKTSEGEEAMRQRTRLVQRNLRNILIMVDGRATVADLVKRFGDENAAMTALNELLAGGYIADQTDQLDFTTPLPADDVPVLTSQVALPESAPAAPSMPAPAPAAAHSQPPVIEEIDLPAMEYESLPPPSSKTSPPNQSVPTPPGWIEKIRAIFAGKPATEAKQGRSKKPEAPFEEASFGGAELEPARSERGFNWTVLAGFALGGLAVLAGLTFLLYPYGRHLPDIERNASAMLQDSVKVGDIGFSLLPRPHLVLRNVSVGKEDAQLRIGSVQAVPDFLSLLGDRKVFRELTLANVTVKDAGLGRLARATAGTPSVTLQRIALRGVSLSAGGVQFSGFEGEIKLAGAGNVEAIELRNAEGTFRIQLQPQGEGYRVAASANAWKSPFTPTLTFQTLEAQGRLRPGRLELDKLEGRAYEGLLAGRLSLDWTDGAKLAGDLELKHMSATRLLAAIGSDLTAEGDLDARLKLSAQASDFGKLAGALRTGGSFEMGRGAVKGLDLVEAARTRGPTRGGETKFEQLNGSLDCDPKECRLGNLRLASGLLKSDGNIGIARSGALKGALTVELKSSAGSVRMPLAVGGTAKDPQLAAGRR